MISVDYEALKARALELFAEKPPVDAGGKRIFSVEQRSILVALTFEPGAVVREIAGIFDVGSNQLSSWRGQMRKGQLPLPEGFVLPEEEAVTFAGVEVVNESAEPKSAAGAVRSRSARSGPPP